VPRASRDSGTNANHDSSADRDRDRGAHADCYPDRDADISPDALSHLLGWRAGHVIARPVRFGAGAGVNRPSGDGLRR
jgi:hypothetical protein